MIAEGRQGKKNQDVIAARKYKQAFKKLAALEKVYNKKLPKQTWWLAEINLAIYSIENKQAFIIRNVKYDWSKLKPISEIELGFLKLSKAEIKAKKIEIANQITELVKNHNLTQHQVAKIAGKTQPDISKVVRGLLNHFSINYLQNILDRIKEIKKWPIMN